MPVKVITTELGHSIPPEGPHTITTHAPGWDTAIRFRSGDPALFAQMKSMYPRFVPFCETRQLSAAIGSKLGFPEGYACLPFLSPDIFRLATQFATNHHRDKDPKTKLTPQELLFRVADVAAVRLYVVAYPVHKTPGIIGLWQNLGTGISTRLSEHLLTQIDSLTAHLFSANGGTLEGLAVPEPTYLPEGPEHGGLKERVVGLLKREAIKEVGVGKGDVYLYGAGMAAIYGAHQAMAKVRKGPVVALGSIFPSTYHLFGESPSGFKHFGDVRKDSGVLEKLEGYIQGEKAEGREVGYVFVEFPSNPILVSVDLKGLRGLADKYGFPVVVDDTVGSFCNVDLLPAADVVVTSLTKSFSGYANVMAGSVTLNPSSPHYPLLTSTLATIYHNEVFTSDAATLLSNSNDYLARSTILNRNALALTKFIESYITRPESPVIAVLYPMTSDTLDNYRSFMRAPTAEFTLGYGCLFSIDFEDKECAKAFYDNLAVYCGPHLGANLTLALPFNELVFGRDPDDAKHHAAYGNRAEQIRVSVGLEEEEELIETFKVALGFAEAEKKRRNSTAH
ncbi:putative cystathionine gamma-synthase protein [Diplogelasinospora grovesii]|uniref:Cystathionine gamma-synthase protein n=1 Tax=Diplogelasinospora grovesii TaxID=303347 RepID=A0AAN6S4M8_9PEZI|nr:putative cystathionine gamma-synthase protein [Diplogelasinospora grovesii]